MMKKKISSLVKILFAIIFILFVHSLHSPLNSSLSKENSNDQAASLISFCYLKRIVDGDTIWVRCYKGFKANETFKVRFADINAPEIETVPGKQSKAFLERFFEKHSKHLLLCVDTKKIYGKYGRVVAVVFIPLNKSCYINLNKYIIDRGYAEPVDYYNSFHPWQWKREVICGKSPCSFQS